MIKKIFVFTVAATLLMACKKEGCTDATATNYSSKAKKDDGSCTYETPADGSYNIPSTYVFKDANGNSTVYYGGQIERLAQLEEMVAKMKSGTDGIILEQDLFDMFSNTGNPFSFVSTKQLEDKCFADDVNSFKNWMTEAALASEDYVQTASKDQAGVLESGGKKYLFNPYGFEPAQIVEKGLMGAIFMYQATSGYFSDLKMNVNNTVAVDAANGKFYTSMEHHFDEAFGYFGVPTNFPTDIPSNFWGKYCNKRDAELNSNSIMMNNFLKGRAAIVNDDMATRDAAIKEIRLMWETISAKQAVAYLNAALGQLGSDQAKAMHSLSEAYGFVISISYAPLETRRMSNTEHSALLGMFPMYMWDITPANINAIIAAIEAKF